MSINLLRSEYPFPDVLPDVPQNYTNGEPTGWCHGDNRNNLQSLLDDKTKVVIDGGSFMGQSCYYMLKFAPNATVIAIDHWEGSAEHQKLPEVTQLYETFIVNLWENRNRIIPVRERSTIGLRAVYDHDIIPDLIYIDWSHDADNVYKDVTCAIRLFPYSIICGDDWTWENVRKGVNEAIQGTKYKIESSFSFWRLQH